MMRQDRLRTTIDSVELLDVDSRYPRVIGRNALLGQHGSGVTARCVVLRTADGSLGWGLTTGRGEPASLLGRAVGDVFDLSIGVTAPDVLWADLALHDLAGALTRMPVHTMIGSRVRRSVELYDGSIYFDDLDAEDGMRGIDAVVANVQDGWEAGYRAFKLKVGRGFTWLPERMGFERDIEVVRAVRAAFPSARLLVDANNGFGVDRAIDLLERLGDVELFWFEEPFQEHRHGLERLRTWRRQHQSTTLIADGEYRPDVAEVLRFAEQGLLDVLLFDIVDHGLTRWRSLATSLAGSRLALSPHAWGMPLKTYYAAHLAAAVPEATIVEGVRGETVGVDTTGYRLVDGALELPDAPGFGMPPPMP